MSHRLLIYHDDARLYQEVLANRLPQLEIHSAIHAEEAWNVIEEAEMILSWQIPDDLLKRAKHLRWFSSTAAGNEDLLKSPYLPKKVVLTKSRVYGEMMAEYVFAYILSFCRNLSKYAEDQRRRVWDRERPERLRGKVMGILGLGSVGIEIAKRAKQFGMVALGVRRVAEPIRYVDEVFGPSNLKKIIPMVDYLVVALPFTPETYHLVGEQELNLIKDGALLFNIGRGKTIDQEALIKILKKKKIKAILDVFETEPLPPENELWRLDNVIITPHVSGINIPDEICEEFIKNYRRWIRGKPLMGQVDRSQGY